MFSEGGRCDDRFPTELSFDVDIEVLKDDDVCIIEEGLADK